MPDKDDIEMLNVVYMAEVTAHRWFIHARILDDSMIKGASIVGHVRIGSILETYMCTRGYIQAYTSTCANHTDRYTWIRQ